MVDTSASATQNQSDNQDMISSHSNDSHTKSGNVSSKGTRYVQFKARVGRCKLKFLNIIRAISSALREYDNEDRDSPDQVIQNYNAIINKSRTDFEAAVDRLIRNKFGVPDLENESANTMAMRHYLESTLRTRYPHLRLKDLDYHIDRAIARAYHPSSTESLLQQFQRLTLTENLNQAYLGKTSVEEERLKLRIKWYRRVYYVFFKRGPKERLRRHEEQVYRQHDFKTASIGVPETRPEVPSGMEFVDPNFRPKTDDSQEENEGKGIGVLSGQVSPDQQDQVALN
jgi:hypothetical protein